MKFQLKAFAFAALAAATGLAFAASPDKVFVADEESSTVSILDAASFKKLASVPVGKDPHNVQIAPDGKLAWVTNNGEKEMEDMGKSKGKGADAMTSSGEVWAIDTDSHAVVAKVKVGNHPAHVVLTSDGRYAYVTNAGDNSVSVVDVAARKAMGTIPVGEYPHGLRVSPDGKEVYVANLNGGTVSVIDTAAQKEVAKIPVGKGPAQTGFAPDGRLAFVSLSGENKVALIDRAARKVVKTIEVGTIPIQMYATPDSKTLIVANQGSKQKPGRTVSVIDLGQGKVVKTVQTGPGAHGVVVDRAGRYAYVTNIYANTVSVLDVKAAKVVANVPVGKGPNGISVTP